MKRTGPMAFVEAVAIMLPAMRGVAAAHAHGVIHRDLKPDNIFLCMDADGSIRDCKVLDFGVSKLTVADAATTGDITLSGNVVGTPEYMAPEQVRAGKHADHRIDIYSLGVVFYEMLAGRPPFVGEHFSGLMLDIMQRDPPPLASLRTDVPRRLAGVIHRALARELDRRYADMPTFIHGGRGGRPRRAQAGDGDAGRRVDHPDRDAAADAGRAIPRSQGSARRRRRDRGRAGGGRGRVRGCCWTPRREPHHPEVAAPAPAQPQPPRACRRGAQRAGRAGRGRAAGRSRAGGRRRAEAPAEKPRAQAPEAAAVEVAKPTHAASTPSRARGQPDAADAATGEGRGGAGGGPARAADDRSRQDNEPVEPVESKGASW